MLDHLTQELKRQRRLKRVREGTSGAPDFKRGEVYKAVAYSAQPDLTPKLTWLQKIWKYLGTFVRRS